MIHTVQILNDKETPVDKMELPVKPGDQIQFSIKEGSAKVTHSHNEITPNKIDVDHTHPRILNMSANARPKNYMYKVHTSAWGNEDPKFIIDDTD